MKQIVQFIIFAFFCLPSALAQGVAQDPDMAYKQQLYAKYKKEVLKFSHKDFDNYFMEYFSRLGEPTPMTRQEYYTYTVKISIYSEKLGLLYKNRLDESNRTKAEWLSRKYSDYLSNRPQKNN